MSSDLAIRAQAAPWHNGIEIMITDGDAVACNLSMEKVPEGQTVAPTMTITNQAAQSLMDELWHAGLRPSEGSGSAGSLKATERHLEDMRTLVFSRSTGGK